MNRPDWVNPCWDVAWLTTCYLSSNQNGDGNVNVKAPLGLIVLLAVAVGYLLGTEAGREQRDRLLDRVRREGASDELIEDLDAAVEG